MKFNELLSNEEQAAIAVLEAGGFRAFTDARLNDVRELGTGRRLRTFRNRGRYQLLIACRDLENRQMPDAVAQIQEGRSGQEPEPDTAPKAPSVELKPVTEMLKEELLAEARTYPDITGEHSMNKPELIAAVQAQRDRRALLHRSFKA